MDDIDTLECLMVHTDEAGLLRLATTDIEQDAAFSLDYCRGVFLGDQERLR